MKLKIIIATIFSVALLSSAQIVKAATAYYTPTASLSTLAAFGAASPTIANATVTNIGNYSWVASSCTPNGTTKIAASGISSSTGCWIAQPVTLPSLAVSGSTSGTITIAPQAAAGTYNFNLPTTAGNLGEVLQSSGGGSAAMVYTAIYHPVANIAALVALGTDSPYFLHASTTEAVSGQGQGGALYDWKSGSCTPNGGTILAATGVSTSTGCWFLNYSGAVHSAWWSIASSNAASVNTTNLQSFVNYLKPGLPGVVDCGNYHINDKIDASGFFGTLDGVANPYWQLAPSYCVGIWQDTDNKPIFYFNTLAYGFVIQNLYLRWNNQQTTSDTLSAGFYFDGNGVNYARWQINNVSVDYGYAYTEENSAVQVTIFSTLMNNPNYGGSMVGPFIDWRQSATTGQGNNIINYADIRGASTEANTSLINLQGCSYCQLNNPTFGQNASLPIINMVSSSLTCTNCKLAESATFTSAAGEPFIFCDTGSFNADRVEISGSVTAAAGQKFYGLAGSCTYNISTNLSIDIARPNGASFFAANSSGIMTIGSITGPDGSSTYAWTDITSTGGVNNLVVTNTANGVLSPDLGDNSASWDPSSSGWSVAYFATPLTSIRGLAVANTQNLSGNGCLKVLVAPGVTASYSLGLYDPTPTAIYTVGIGKSGMFGICYKRTAGINTTTWYPMQ